MLSTYLHLAPVYFENTFSMDTRKIFDNTHFPFLFGSFFSYDASFPDSSLSYRMSTFWKKTNGNTSGEWNADNKW